MEELGITDPGFDKQWHLVNTVTVGNDMNVTGVWKQGITGYNSTVCFVDDGLDMDNADLHDNFYAEGSYDFNAHTKSPKPKLAADRHGTRCAGEVAAVKNDICGVGVAYTAKVSGVRILGGPLTEADEAASINYDYQNNQIYSCSWGPTDDGRAMDAPPQLVTDAVYNGIKNGRNGLGSIFVFASGNGEASGDHCNADGYTNSIYTVTVGALDRNNQHPVYSESCTAVMIVMYSSSGQHQDAIYTSDWSQAGNVHCTNNHGGTSAAAPLASGLYALVLQIRPDLNWRDIQYLSVQSAIPVNLDDPGWDTTAAGRPYNPKFGYGKLDGYALVEAAKTFKSVNPQTQIITNVAESHKDVPATPAFLDSKVVVSADNVKAADMKRVEHVTVTVNIDHESRGDVEVQLISPKGIVSQLSVKRAFDADIFGYQNWTFMSVKHWGEDPVGTWTLRVSDALHPAKTGKFNYWWLTLFGETVHGPTVSPSPPIPSAAVPSASSLSTHSTTTTSSKPSPTRPHGSDEEDRLQPPILPTLTTTSTLTSSSSSSPTSSSSSLPVGDGSGGTATSGKVKSSGYALAFGVGVLATAGGGFWYVRRRRSSRSTAGGPQDSTDDYEFELLNDDEVEAAFEDYDDDDEDGGRGASSVQLVGRTSGESGKVPSTTMGVSGGSGTGAGSGKPDRFVLKGMDDDDEGLP
ncbi:pheromone processing endoprotease [Thoreauomyces humboldtii]|nr:pheromone processing endoprotease [Thoreauomyces humboldtii]